MSLLFNHDLEVCEYVGKILGKPFSMEPVPTTIGIVSQGRLTGGYVFTGYTGDVIELSLAGKGVASRSTWNAVLDYVFRQLNCSRLQVHTRRDNARARKQANRLGFRYEGTLRAYYRDCPALVFSLVKDDIPAFRTRWKLGGSD